MGGVQDVSEAPAERRVLLIDDEVELARGMARMLAGHGFASTVFHDPIEALAHLGEHLEAFDVVLLDINMPSMHGLEVLAHIKQLDCITPVIMWSTDEHALTATAAMRAGAFSYTTKPSARFADFIALLQSAASFCTLRRYTRELERASRPASPPPTAIGTSRVMAELQARAERFARSEIAVLVLGESGTGKELVAKTLHAASARARRPFVAINCGAIAESLIDSELFGHARGAFTGAVEARPGVFLEADGGTLFLDEIGEMPLAVQARLLRVLQEREIRPVGGQGVVRVDVRVVAATHARLADAVEAKTFRADLYYRLAVATIEVPPLRARASDIPMLAAHFVAKHARGRPVQLTPEALDALLTYRWPGNVRELENALQYALALMRDDVLDAGALPAAVTAGADVGLPRPVAEWSEAMTLAEAKKRALHDFERAYITRALSRANGNLTEAARASGLDRSNFRRVATRLGIAADAFRG